jgi:hypothetical protein
MLNETVQVAGRAVTVRELSVREIRDWLHSAKAPEHWDAVDELLLGELSLTDLARMTTVGPEVLGEAYQSELAELLAVAKKLNPLFFGLAERLAQVAREARPDQRSDASTAVSPS